MTTTTEAPTESKAGPLAALEKARERLEEARQQRAELDQKARAWLPEMVKGADNRIAEREAEVRSLIRPRAPELARAEYERALEAKQKVRVLSDQMRAAIGEVNASHPVLLDIATATGGELDGRSVEVDPRWQELDEMLAVVDEFEPARIPAMTPYEDEDPVIRRTADDSWVDVHYDPKAGWHDEQPEPVERPS